MGKSSTRLLAIVAVIVLFVAAWYMIISGGAEKNSEYENNLAIAREKADLDLRQEAITYYGNALWLKDSLELRVEIANFYYGIEEYAQYSGACNEMISLYPHDAAGYEMLAQYYDETNDYNNLFTVINSANRRGIESETIDTLGKKNEWKYELTNDYVTDVTMFSNNLSAVMNSDGRWGYFGRKGGHSIAFSYSDATPFSSEGFAAVKNVTADRYVLIDTSGVEKRADAEKKDVEDCLMPASGKMSVKYGGKYHYCDYDFKPLFGEYDEAGTFNCGVAAVRNGSSWSIIGEDGNKVTEKTFEDVKLDSKGIAFRNNVAFAKTGGKYVLIDTAGNQVGSGSWDDADTFVSGGAAAVCKDGKWGFVNTSGEEIGKFLFDGAHSFMNGRAAVAVDGKWGFVDEELTIVIPCEFADGSYFTDAGTVFVKDGEAWTLLKIFSMNVQ